MRRVQHWHGRGSCPEARTEDLIEGRHRQVACRLRLRTSTTRSRRGAPVVVFSAAALDHLRGGGFYSGHSAPLAGTRSNTVVNNSLIVLVYSSGSDSGRLPSE